MKHNAIEILNDNWRDGFTIPCEGLYPFQWKWDSGFIAIGLAHFDITVSEWKTKLPEYHMSKMKVALTPDMDADHILATLKIKYADENLDLQDGLKIDFPEYWVHIRKSNTEAIVRIYTEAHTVEKAKDVARSFKSQIQNLY